MDQYEEATRKRWKDSQGRIFEWNYEYGVVDLYDKEGKHLGAFDHVTGDQAKPAKPGQMVEI